MKNLFFCLLVASAFTALAQASCNAQTVDKEAFLAKYPSEAMLSPNFIASAHSTMAAVAQMHPEGKEVVGSLESSDIASKTYLSAKTVGEHIVGMALTAYQREVQSLAYIAVYPPAKEILKPTLFDIQACHDALVAALNDGQSPAHILACEPIKHSTTTPPPSN